MITPHCRFPALARNATGTLALAVAALVCHFGLVGEVDAQQSYVPQLRTRNPLVE